jgi:hypothetical protein
VPQTLAINFLTLVRFLSGPCRLFVGPKICLSLSHRTTLPTHRFTMFPMRKNALLLIILIFTAVVIAVVVYMFNRRIKTIEDEMKGLGRKPNAQVFITHKHDGLFFQPFLLQTPEL